MVDFLKRFFGGGRKGGGSPPDAFVPLSDSRFITDQGSIGVLIGVPAASVPSLIEDTPNATVRIASVVLLTAAELEHVATGRAEAREEVLAHLLATTGHLCDVERPSAV